MYQIKLGELSDILAIEPHIPEFNRAKNMQQITERLGNKPYLLLIAYHENAPVGYKLGYALSDNTFYSWLGAVLPNHRGKGLAQKMLTRQETWLQQNGYNKVQVKTMNCFRAMLAMLVKNNYFITGVEPNTNNALSKIHFEKVL